MFDSFVSKYAAIYSVPEAWIQAVIQTESSGNPNAYRAEPRINDASYGLMQLLFGTAKKLGYTGEPNGLFDPDTNIRLGAKLLADLRSRYGENAERVYSAYNSGNPDAFKSNTQVSTNVERFMSNLESAVSSHPFIASAGAAGALVTLTLLWFWGKGKH